jgi:aminopeptidase
MDLIDRYAQLAVRVGVNVAPRQDVLIRAYVEQMAVARAVAEQAYRAGARKVVVKYQDQHVRRSTVKHAPVEALSTAYAYEVAQYLELVECGGAFVSLTGDPNPHLLDDLDPSRVALQPRALGDAIGTLASRCAWTMIAVPTPGWAEAVFGEPDTDRLWNAVEIATRLDAPDPVAAWRSHLAMLDARRRSLDRLAAAAIRFRGPGTDLMLPLLPGGAWLTGTDHTPEGHEYVANLPTEEVYTSPWLGHGEGTVRATRPLPMGGAVVEGLSLRITGGRVVDVQADRGAELVRTQLALDPHAAFLGEVAIVDGSSRLAQLGLVFHDTLYDENTGCHLAYGRGFPEAIPGGPAMTDEEKLAAGLNVSSVHTDIVIGGPEVDVDALDADGHAWPIVRENTWQLPLD